jgi:hypothetical protein
MNASFYDWELGQLLGVSNNSSGVTLNSEFTLYEPVIYQQLASPVGGKGYDFAKNRELYEACKVHAREHSSPKGAKKAVVLTHPFYVHLSHMDELNSQEKGELREYTSKLFQLLTSNTVSDDLDIFIMETIHGYGAATSILLEKGMVDSVIFTKCDSGRLIKKSDMDPLKKATLYFGGGYNKRCPLNL